MTVPHRTFCEASMLLSQQPDHRGGEVRSYPLCKVCVKSCCDAYRI